MAAEPVPAFAFLSGWRLSSDFDKLIPAPGPGPEKDAKPFVQQAFWWLAR